MFQPSKSAEAPKRVPSAPKRTGDDWGKRSQATIEAEFVSLLLAHPHLIGAATESIAPKRLANIKLRNLYQRILTAVATGGVTDTASFIGSLDDDSLLTTATFLTTSSDRWNSETAPVALKDFVVSLSTQPEHRTSIKELSERLKAAEAAGDKEQTQAILREFEEVRKR